MTCPKGPREESYDFFNNFDTYEKLLEPLKKESHYVVGEKGCIPFLKGSNTLLRNIRPYAICRHFKYMYKSLILDKSKSESDKKNDFDFLNYWLNDKLRNNSNDNLTCVDEFFKKMETNDKEFFNSNTSLEGKFRNIFPDNFENMKILFDLYNIKKDIYSVITSTDYSVTKCKGCSEYIKQCRKSYMDGINNCVGDCNGFYEGLIQFKNSCKNDFISFTHALNEDEYNELLQLPDPYVYLEHKKIPLKSITGTTISFLMFGLIYMLKSSNVFAPFRRILMEKIQGRQSFDIIGNEQKEPISLISEFENTMSDGGKYNIGYYSSRNS
ncbi:PIR Superfamily Protein [Plasmodium ovale wallikeri]|uniref:PIR Superfamily Protein n=1 Tax=Plasmodium ovale wallikeri TaxID=864142 RepID=A0A1A9AGF3_PLAOA|nr:PIR Superfamily Protein [Plasmodium ovale wallikeri]SBT57760.1 PIR Superfamily Protein [Plasmodium ovale wallikeri]